MEPLKRCALLALALLQVVVLAEESGCPGEMTGCRVVRGKMSGELTTLECGGTTSNKTLESPPNSCETNDTSCEISSGVNDRLEIGDSNITESPLEKLNVSSSYQHRNGNKSNSDELSRSSFIRVNLVGGVSVLDMSYFSSAKTVIINSYGFHILKVCGANGVSELTVTCSPNVDLSFVKSFSNLEFLNLSRNGIGNIPDTELPPSISSIDLSFNKISLNKNYSLPRNLRMLNISYNNIGTIEGFILKGNVIVLDIRQNSLTRVPVIKMKNLEELYLSYNNITALNEKTFIGLMNLTILDLRANRLNDIEEKVFQGLNRLQWLDLSENNIISLAPATFQYLSNLVTLLLSKNINLGNLQDFEDASLLFGTGQRLQEIEASGTNLSRIPSTVTRSVRKLLLSDNAIRTIQCGEVDSFPLLQVIDVSNNMISEIEEDALGRLEFLSDLILTGNKLENIPKSLPNQLQVLDMRCNTIYRLNNFDFLGLQKLRVLLLSMNNISVVEDGAFGQLINLDVLDLSYNPIKTLYRSSFTGPRRLKELYLIALTDLIPLKEPLSFPAPESSHLEVLSLYSSPELATRLMDDVAALTMFHELYELSLGACGLKTLRNDLPSYLPRLHKLEITNNPINCTDILWLTNWLQSLNVSTQDAGVIRRFLDNNRHRSCRHVSEHKRTYIDNVTCASPEIFSGKPIVSLKEEDFPDLRTKQSTPSTTERLTLDTTTETITQPVAEEEATKDGLHHGTTSHTTETISSPLPTGASLNELVTIGHAKEIIQLTKNTSVNFNTVLNNTQPKQSKVTKSENSLNKLQNTWRYSKTQSKYPHSMSEPFIVLLNDTKHSVGVIDNQINDSISSGAFSAHEPPPTTHPGMMVFLFIVGVIVVASSAMVYSHYAQLRRSTQYHHHQDIEVSSFGGHELW